MIPVNTFNMLIAFDIVLIVYSIVDHENRLYANIATMVIAAIVARFIGVAAVSNVVYDVVGTTPTVMNSPSLDTLMYFVSVVMFAYAVLMVAEVIDEAMKEKESKKAQALEDRI